MENNTQPQQELPQVTVQDLASLTSCIELAASRGAFRANEMTAIGALYDKLSSFLQAVTPPPTVTPPPGPDEIQPISDVQVENSGDQ